MRCLLCAAEGKSASEPPAPQAGSHSLWMRAAHLSEARGKLRLACFTQQIGVALGVIPKMGFGVHGPSFHSPKTCRETASFHSPSARFGVGIHRCPRGGKSESREARAIR